MDTPDRWADVSRLYHAALEQSPERRSAFLDEECSGDEALRREVDSLLACHADAATFLAGAPAAATVAVPTLVGRQLGAYRIEAPIGSGGMGEVYRATDTRLQRPVAIKILPRHVRASPELRRQFEQEARAVAALAHPHICVLHDIGRDDTVEFLVLEHLEGETLAARLTRGPLPTHETFRYAIEIADALAETHKRGIVHRDLKPANIMLTAAGAKLLDFGLATRQPGPDDGDADATREPHAFAGIAGTLSYMAPEQLAGREADRRTDIFAFGAIVYEMATGLRAFDGASRPVHRAQGVSPRALRRIVVRCLAHEPERRYPSMEPVAAMLRNGKRQLWRPPVSATTATAVVLLAVAMWLGGPYLSIANQAPFAATTVRLLAIVSMLATGYGWAAWRHRGQSGTPRTALYLPALGALLMASWGLWLTWITYDARPRPAFARSSAARPAMFENLRQLVDGESLDGTMAISRDGRQLAYISRDEHGFALVFRSGRGDTEATVVRSTAPIAQPRWSPDGTRLSYITPAGAFVVRVTKGAPQRIDRQVPRFAGYSSRLVTPAALTGAAWSPDGERMAITTGGSMFVVALHDGTVRAVVQEYRHELHSCEWSPDGKLIACAAGLPLSTLAQRVYGSAFDEGRGAIVLIAPDGGDPRPLTAFVGANLSPAWSADSTRVYFVSNRHGRYDIYAAEVGAAGPAPRAPRRLTVGLDARAVSVSATGRLAYLVRRQQTNIWALPVGTVGRANEPSPVTTGDQTVEALMMTRDGMSLRYAASRNGEEALFQVPLGGGEPERLPGQAESASAGPRIGINRPRPDLSAVRTPSPDDLYLAYIDPSRPEEGVRVVPRHQSGSPALVPGATWPVSWTANGNSLIYVHEGRVLRQDIAEGYTETLYAPRRDSPDPVVSSAVMSRDGRQLVMKSYDARSARLSFWIVPVERPAPRAAGPPKQETGGLLPPSFWLESLPAGRPTLVFSAAPVPPPRMVPSLAGGVLDFAIGGGHLYFTREERQAGIWIGDLLEDAATP